MTRSAAAMARSEFSRITVSIVFDKTSISVFDGDTDRARAPTSTAITTPVPMPRTTSAGTLLRAPPSMSRCGPIVTGSSTAGSAIDPRMASARLPAPSTIWRAVIRSVAIALKGVGRSSKLASSKYGSAIRSRSSARWWPVLMERGRVKPPFSPNSSAVGIERESCLRRKFFDANGTSVRR